ncbi:hypothetical protein SAMN05421853_11372 [Roseivivax halotolerans]|uniref:PAS domain-containing protein n=1 Tax=Roseivivax halotolerans TaxID=93684 RepID=A0A1I5ZZE6_9RHOB|nr:PAS domain-containing protein [Roseivivax halotolerans]SFQ61839.1 hypothetical protein SAMN05421853_11372 [Roseivivax halotolerans]
MTGDWHGGTGYVSLCERSRERQRRALRLIETYWQDLSRDACGIPERAAVDPRRIEDGLEYAFLLQRIAPGQARLRIAGAHLNDLTGMEVAGLPLSALILPDHRARLAKALEAMFRDGGILRAEMSAQTGFGRPELRAEMTVLPLRSESGQVDRAIGGLITIGKIGRTPRRFELGALKVQKVGAPSREMPVTGFAEAPTPFAPSRLQPHLRLVVCND